LTIKQAATGRSAIKIRAAPVRKRLPAGKAACRSDRWNCAPHVGGHRRWQDRQAPRGGEASKIACAEAPDLRDLRCLTGLSKPRPLGSGGVGRSSHCEDRSLTVAARKGGAHVRILAILAPFFQSERRAQRCLASFSSAPCAAETEKNFGISRSVFDLRMSNPPKEAETNRKRMGGKTCGFLEGNNVLVRLHFRTQKILEMRAAPPSRERIFEVAGDGFSKITAASDRTSASSDRRLPLWRRTRC
jgi:hypothetical protein